MAVELVPAKPEHVDEMGRICYEAFKDIADRHHFPPDFSSAAFARMVLGSLVEREDCYVVAALEDGQPVGSSGLLISDAVAGVGPVSVAVPAQGRGIGRAIMRNVIEHARQSGIEMVRLMQSSFNMGSLSLYASLGFDTRERHRRSQQRLRGTRLSHHGPRLGGICHTRICRIQGIG